VSSQAAAQVTERHGIVPDLLGLATPVVNLSELPNNPRRGDVEAIARSFAVFGQRKPLVARRTGSDADGNAVGIVTAGNHGLKAARDELGWSHVAVVWTDDDETTAAAFGLADNHVPELGSYDQALLAEQLSLVAATDAELLAATAYTSEQLADLVLYDGETPPTHEVETEPLTWGVFDLDTVVESAFAHYRATGLPMRLLSVHECMQEVNALAALSGDRLIESTLGYAVADTYNPHRFAARVEGRSTVHEVFARDEYLTHALRLLAAQGNRITDQTLLSVMPYVRGAQVASNFRPGYALSMYRRFAFDDAVVLDTSMGYGGRLVGFLASTCARYVGIDPATETCAANDLMAADLAGARAVELINLPAEDVTSEVEPASCDFAFTSPPYFAKERYSDEATQSCNRYSSGEDWRDGFLRPMIELQYRSLKAGRWAALNIADVKVGPNVYPLTSWATDAAIDAGFQLARVERFPLGGRVPGQGVKRDASEPVLILQKPAH
jgi:hypothetical protein